MVTIGCDFRTLERARANAEKPTFIEIKTIIGKGIPEVVVHRPDMARVGRNLPRLPARVGLPEETFVSDECVLSLRSEKNIILPSEQWDEIYAAWRSANQEKAAFLVPESPVKYPRI